MEGAGFEPAKAEPADLQSAPVDRLGTPPKVLLLHHFELATGIEPATVRLQGERSTN